MSYLVSGQLCHFETLLSPLPSDSQPGSCTLRPPHPLLSRGTAGSLGEGGGGEGGGRGGGGEGGRGGRGEGERGEGGGRGKGGGRGAGEAERQTDMQTHIHVNGGRVITF